MEILIKQPVVVGIALDGTTEDVVRASLQLAKRLETSLVPVHALRPWPFPTARNTDEEAERARVALRAALAAPGIRDVPIAEPIVQEASATTLVLDVADRTHAQLVIVGAGRGPTVTSWLLGSVADRVVRSARCPVLIARGTLPGPQAPIVCPVDMSPHSQLGLEAALRMARRFDAPLRVVSVIPDVPGNLSITDLQAEATANELAMEAQLGALSRAHDTRDVAMELRVRRGDPATCILEEAEAAQLVVIASRAFDMLVPASLGDVASRVVRNARCSVLAVRDLEPDAVARTLLVDRVVELRDAGRAALERSDLTSAEGALRVAAALLPGHAPIEDDLANVLDRAGRPEEAARMRALARILRDAHA